MVKTELETNSEMLIRNFQLYILSNIELDGKDLLIFNDLEKFFSSLKIYIPKNIEDDKYGTYQKTDFYGKSSDNIIFELDIGNRCIWVHQEKIWDYFSENYNISDEHLESILKWYINYMFKFDFKSWRFNSYKMDEINIYLANGLILKNDFNN